MDKKFKFIFSKKLNIAFYLLLSLTIIGIIVDIVFLSMAIINDYISLAPYIVSLCFLVVILIGITILKIGSYYKLKKDTLVVSYMFIPIKIAYDDILMIRSSVSRNLNLLYYKYYDKAGVESIRYTAICISNELIKVFYDEIKSHNNLIIYENFDDIKGEEN